MHDKKTPASSQFPIYDVLIAGAGPVGLFLACELRLAGLSVLILEQAQDPQSPLKQLPFGMRGLSAPTIEAFYRRGLLDEITASQPEKDNSRGASAPSGAHWMQQSRRPAGHFAGIQIFMDNIDSSRWPYRLPSPAPTNLPTTMQNVESILAARATALGVQIRRGVRVGNFEQSEDDVTVRTDAEHFRGKWLVGCDGGRSAVRKAGGFEFVGTDPEFTGYSVQMQLSDPEKLTPGRQYTPTGMYTFQKPDVIAMVDFDGGVSHRTQPVTAEHVQTVLRRVSCTDITVMALELATTWTDRAYHATEYRKGRVLLAGDAAHIHSPLGGQGLNLGLGDAMNLGWKLAATIRGDAPTDLLNTYTSERHAVGAAVLDWSRAQVAIMRPNRSSRALEAILRDVIETRDGATYFAERVWGVSLHYDLGGSHPLVGHSVPDFDLNDGRKPGELLAAGKGLLVDFDADPSLHALACRWNGRVTYVACSAKDRLGLSAVMVRPDGYVAWASEATASLADAAQAAVRWFGEPSRKMI